MIDQTLTELIQGDAPSGVILDRLREIHTGKDDEALATAYVVVGETGEYSDHTDWYVAAFIDKEAADDLCKKLNDWCEENNVNKGAYEVCNELGFDLGDPKRNQEYNRRDQLGHPPLDPHFPGAIDAVKYSVCPIPLKG